MSGEFQIQICLLSLYLLGLEFKDFYLPTGMLQLLPKAVNFLVNIYFFLTFLTLALSGTSSESVP